MRFTTLLALVILLTQAPAFGWNALGHKVIAEIAWQELNEDQRTEIVDILKRHPRFGEDFVNQMPAVDPPDQWIFQHAATWPDIARGIRGPDRDKFDKPIWHYVNFPLTIDGFPAPKLNLASDPARGKSISWNIVQATEYCRGVIQSEAPVSQKALAYSWLFHLVGDMHQPMHSTALFCERYPKGDRSGNSIKLTKGDNLHSLWDGLIGRSHNLNNVRGKVAQLRQDESLWEVETAGTPEDWVAESHKVAQSIAYESQLLDQIGDASGQEPFSLSEEYYPQSGKIARQRVVAAGLRLAALLGAKPGTSHQVQTAESYEPSQQPFVPVPKSRDIKTGEAGHELGFWLNTNSHVRHNSGCRHFEKTRGRPCGPDEGKPCGICGG